MVLDVDKRTGEPCNDDRRSYYIHVGSSGQGPGRITSCGTLTHAIINQARFFRQ